MHIQIATKATKATTNETRKETKVSDPDPDGRFYLVQPELMRMGSVKWPCLLWRLVQFVK
jgi:hypothetical protein